MKDKIKYRKLIDTVWKVKTSRLGLLFICLLVFFALFADFLAGDIPIASRDNQGWSSPLYQQYTGKLRFGRDFILNWKEEGIERVVYPLIPFGPSEIDQSIDGYSPPGTRSNMEKKGVHILGTDQLGRDLASGIIHGSRIALVIGLLSILLAFLAGIIIGSMAGYYGDHMVRWSVFKTAALSIGFVLVLYYTVQVNWLWFRSLSFFWSILGVLLFFGLFMFMWFLLINRIDRKLRGGRRISIPVDLAVMRFLEVFKSIPGLFIVLTILALVQKPGIWTIILLIGFLRWPSFARYTRAEYLALRDKPFIQNLRLYGQSDPRIVWNHLLPNSLAPLIVLAAFGISSSIVLEATFSFLGIGLPPDHVSWGSLINSARSNISAWWLAVFPGLAILCTVLAFNAIGRSLNSLFTEQIRYTL